MARTNTLMLSSLLVQRVALAPLAVLLQLNAIRIILLVLLGRVVTALALRTRQGDQRTHEFSFLPFMETSSNDIHMNLTNGARVGGPRIQIFGAYLKMVVTRPEPTVRPPSRIANFRPSSMAIG